jgi:O-antigen ligase
MKNLLAIIYLIIGLALILYFIQFGISVSQYLILIFLMALVPLLILKPGWGLLALLMARNVIDIFDQQSVLALGPLSFNLASLLGILLIPWAALIIMKKLRDRCATGLTAVFSIPLVKPWLSFIGVVIVSALVTRFTLSASLEVIIKLIDFFLLYLVGYLLAEEIGFKKFLQWMFVILLVPGLAAMVQIGSLTRLSGTFVHSNALAFTSLIAVGSLFLLVSLIKDKKIILRWQLITVWLLIVLILTFTRSAWVGLAIVSGIWIIYYRRKLIVPGFVLVALLAVIYPAFSKTVNDSYGINLNQTSLIQRLQPEEDVSGSSVAWRLRIWGETLPAVWRRPWLGYGPGSFPGIRRNLILYETDLAGLEAHNDYLRLAIEVGLIGLLAYVWLYINILRNLLKLKNLKNKKIIIGICALVIAIMVVSFSDNVLRDAPVEWMFWSLIGVTMASLKYEKLSNYNH